MCNIARALRGHEKLWSRIPQFSAQVTINGRAASQEVFLPYILDTVRPVCLLLSRVHHHPTDLEDRIYHFGQLERIFPQTLLLSVLHYFARADRSN